jgi:hypothetical protein
MIFAAFCVLDNMGVHKLSLITWVSTNYSNYYDAKNDKDKYHVLRT